MVVAAALPGSQSPARQGWPWLAAIARCGPAWGLAGLGWRTPTHTAHTHKTHKFIGTKVNVPDCFTKALLRGDFLKFRAWCMNECDMSEIEI